MLSFRPGTRIFISTEPTDMRKGFDGLSAIVEHAWGDSPLSGDLFVFANRRQTLLKMIYWDTDGYAIWYKRLEQGTFRIPSPTAEGRIELTAARLAMILEGIDIKNTRKRKRYRRVQPRDDSS
jgi:transposase